MKHTLLVLCFGLLSSFFAYADGAMPSTSKEAYCANRKNPDYYKGLTEDTQNLIGFINPAAGIADGGLCWWHSELQRNSLYLAVYRPDLPKPTDPKEVAYIFEAIMKKQAVMEIPGYSNFSDFTSDYQDLLTKLLAEWQITQGVLGFGWIDGINTSTENADSFKSSMDDLYNRVMKKNEIVFTVLKMSGVTAHAWNVTHMTPTPDGGYQLEVLDSNFIGAQDWTYTPGMTSFNYYGYSNFVPRVFRESDLQILQSAADDYCSGNVDPTYKIYQMPNSSQIRQLQVNDPCEDEYGNSGQWMEYGEFGNLFCQQIDQDLN